MCSIAYYLIRNIDEAGYLAVSIEETAIDLGVSPFEVESALARLQSLDPPGIGARNLRECLLLQASRKGKEFSICCKMVSKHFPLLCQLNLDEIAYRLGQPQTLIKLAVRKLGTLDLAPGRHFQPDPPIHIIPDARVYKYNGDWVVQLLLRERSTATFKKFYRNYLPKSWLNTQEAREFFRRHGSLLHFSIRSRFQRQRTLYRIVKAITKYQRDFLDYGLKYLKPLTLKDIAMETEMAESTISRVTTQTYLETPREILPLKFFFTSGLGQSTEKQNVSSTSVKDRIHEIIKAEEQGRALSDQEILEMLRREGIVIARRTITKYRQELGILGSAGRQKLRKADE